MSQPGAWTVTPEAVLVELPTATLGTRAPARALDILVELAGGGAVFAVLGVVQAGTIGFVVAAAVVGFGLIFVYPAVMEGWARGRTIGKMALGLRVVTTQGAPVGFRQAAIRAALGPVDLIAGAVVMLCSRQDQRLGDVLAGTVVVRDRAAAQSGGVVYFPVPYGCEGLVASLDVSGVTEADYEALRSYLLRWGELDPAPRWTIGVDLARTLATRFHHALPEWIGPDQYLACVAAGYQFRQRRAAPVAWPTAATTWSPAVAGPSTAGSAARTAGGWAQVPPPAGPLRPPT